VKNVFLHWGLKEEIYVEVPVRYCETVIVKLFADKKGYYMSCNNNLEHGLESPLRLQSQRDPTLFNFKKGRPGAMR